MGLVKQRTKEEVEEKIIDLLMGYPVHTITFDIGKEFAGHEKINQVLGSDIFFALKYALWKRWTNENTNGLIRQYIPKNSDFRKLTNADISFDENQLNLRPRKCLDFSQPMVTLKNHCCI
jgi:IS30 family transposase